MDTRSNLKPRAIYRDNHKNNAIKKKRITRNHWLTYIDVGHSKNSKSKSKVDIK